MIKKSLVALAAVAVTGGAFAQATMSGTMGFGYYNKQTKAGVTTGGMGKDTSNVDFSVAETIDGVGKLSGKMGINLGTADTPTVGREFSVGIDMGSMGSLKFVSDKGDDYLSCGIAAAGSCVAGSLASGSISSVIDLFTTLGYDEALTYKYKVSDAVSISFKMDEPTDSSSSYANGEGSGAAGYGDSSNYQRHNTVSLDYAAGALTFNAGYRAYDLANNATGNANYRTRASFAYDLGVAKIGAGFVQHTYTYGNTRTDSLMGLSIPVPGSAVTLSGQWANRTKNGNASASSDTSYSGSMYTAVYQMSKRTKVYGFYASNQSSGTSNPYVNGLVLEHSF